MNGAAPWVLTMTPVEKGGAPPGFRLDGAALWRACGVNESEQDAGESNAVTSTLEIEPRPSRASYERGLRAPVIATVVGHHRELPTCTQAASVSGRTCTLSLSIRSRALYLLSYRDIDRVVRGNRTRVARVRSGIPRPLEEHDKK